MGEIKKIWLDKNKCTGCGMCSNICPKSAIVMETDKCGFLYPKITSSCVNCGLCEKICNKRVSLKANQPIKVYAAWSSNKERRFFSTSGGVFGELAYVILKNGGYVAGAAYNDRCLVEHIVIHSLEELYRIQQSKYIQSDSKNIYSQIKKILEEGNVLLFCGTPCQIAALKSFLGKDYEKAIFVDFICRGVNSPKAFKAWGSEIENKKKLKIKKVWFKYKEGGWKSSPKRTRLDYDDGSSEVFNGDKNLFMMGYLGPNLYIRPSCGLCDFKGAERNSDITLADFWGIEKKYDDNKGTSMVMINSEKGMELWQKIRPSIFEVEKKIDNIVYGNPCFTESVKINEQSEKFLELLDEKPFSEALRTYYKRPNRVNTFVRKVFRKIKANHNK